MSEEVDRDFENLLEIIKRSRGFDFSGYKRSSLIRRFRRRMQTVSVDSFRSYADYLEVHPEEFGQLFNTILINVTSFFRDEAAWEYLKSDILPRIAAEKKPDEPIRVWSAGCASGEEAYTLAMVLAEFLGREQFCERVKIFATDVDEEALARARQATYSQRDVQCIPEELLKRYFERANTHYVFDKELRRAVIFGRHDLVQDAPISRIDLLVCRNTLMYFNADAQGRMLLNFHFALNDKGYLFLGKAEMLLTHASLFVPVDVKQRVFSRVPRSHLRDQLLARTVAPDEGGNTLLSDARQRELAFDTAPVAQVVVEPTGALVLANAQARGLFGISARDLGRPFRDLEISYRPIELRGPIDQASAERRMLLMRDIRWALPSGDVKYLDVQITPLNDTRGSLQGVSITFADVTRHRELQEELQHSRQDLETAYEELQSANEELETTNEELQSTVEELETTNEELQSTNEELETMNEELQSTNEELETVNTELRQRTGELNEVNLFLEAILGSMRSGIVVTDTDLKIQIWNARAEDLWGLRQSEVQGKHFMNLDIGLPVEQLRQPARACLSGESQFEEVTLDAVNRRGKAIRCRVQCTPMAGPSGEVRGVILLMEDAGEREPA